MIFHTRKSAALAIDGHAASCASLEQVSPIDIDDINIWLQTYLRARAQPNRVIRKTMTFDQISLDCAARRTLLDAFEYRYSVVLDAPDIDCFASVHTLAKFLLAQMHSGQKETTRYLGARHMVRTLLSAS
jgi:hypothetical protein